jgi:hypothetical protein
MGLSLLDSQSVSELEVLLYDFIPGSHFRVVSASLGLADYWQDGISKGPAISQLLSLTYEFKKDKFCPLIIKTVQDAIAYGNRKGTPLRRTAVEEVNRLLLKLKFKIPELWDSEFLATLHADIKTKEPEEVDIKSFLDKFMNLLKLEPHIRGFAFERFLFEFFKTSGLKPRAPFKIVGEQIDGSFDFKDEVYLLEAKWQNEKTNEADLLVFRGKIESRAEWTRGLFISYAGFSEDGLIAFSRGKRTNMIGMTGEDLSSILLDKRKLEEVLVKKIRIAAETGDFFFPVSRM